MDLTILLSFAIASFLLAIMPGPDNILVLTESLSKHYKNGIALALGMNSGVLVHTLAAATGISLILSTSQIAFTVVKILGALYLFYLAYRSWKESEQEIELDNNSETASSSYLTLYKQGFIMNVLNPKVSLFFIALLPQFIIEDGFRPMYQMFILGVVFMIIGAIVFSGIAILSTPLQQHIKGSKFWVILKYSKVIVLVILGIGLILSSS